MGRAVLPRVQLGNGRGGCRDRARPQKSPMRRVRLGFACAIPVCGPRVHLFLTGSAAAVLALGYQWNMMPETTVYE